MRSYCMGRATINIVLSRGEVDTLLEMLEYSAVG